MASEGEHFRCRLWQAELDERPQDDAGRGGTLSSSSSAAITWYASTDDFLGGDEVEEVPAYTPFVEDEKCPADVP